MSEDKRSELEIEERKGGIIIKMNPPKGKSNYVILTPDQAKDVGTVLQTYSYHAKYGNDPASKNMLADQMKAKLQTRLPHIIRSLENKNKTPAYIAQNIIDVILSEVM